MRKVEAGERATLAIHSPADGVGGTISSASDLSSSLDTRTVWRPCVPDNPYNHPLIVPSSPLSSPEPPLLHPAGHELPVHQASEGISPKGSGGLPPMPDSGAPHPGLSSHMQSAPAHDGTADPPTPSAKAPGAGLSNNATGSAPLCQEAYRIREAAGNGVVLEPAQGTVVQQAVELGQETGEMEWLPGALGTSFDHGSGSHMGHLQPQQAVASSPSNPPRKVRAWSLSAQSMHPSRPEECYDRYVTMGTNLIVVSSAEHADL